MSETEINEDNCVLNENDLLNIDTALFMMGGRNKGSETYLDDLSQKITKLNDRVKEAKKDDSKGRFSEVPE